VNRLAALQILQDRPRFFDEHCASKDYDGCNDADGFERMRITLLEEPLRPFDAAPHRFGALPISRWRSAYAPSSQGSGRALRSVSLST
jgi:hypothetical protein